MPGMEKVSYGSNTLDIPPVVMSFLFLVGSEETVSVGSDEDQNISDSGEETDSGEMRGAPAPRGRADSGALLDMLAEVASQKLLFSPMKRDADRRDADGKLTSSQVKGLSTNQLIHLFSTTEFDEMRKWYTYFCAFDQDCPAKFVSFGNENRAKEKFKQHLFTHLETLKSTDSLCVSKRRTSASRRPRRTKVKDVVEEEPELKMEYEEEDEEEEIIEEEPQEIEGEEEEAEEEEEDLRPKLEWGDSFLLPEPENKVRHVGSRGWVVCRNPWKQVVKLHD